MNNKPTVSIICALAENRVIGKDNKLLWHIPEDMKRFRRITSGHPVIMGRKTYESIGKLLANRVNVIITRDPHYIVEGGIVLHSLDEALQYAKNLRTDEIFVIGGAQIYTQALPIADRLYLTIVHKEFEGDAVFPEYSGFKKVKEEEGKEGGEYRYTFLELERQQ